MPLSFSQIYPHIHLGVLNRLFTKTDFDQLYKAISAKTLFKKIKIGSSYAGEALEAFTIGKGETRILLWTQMHGNEPTATHAILELMLFFSKVEFKEWHEYWLQNLTISIVPVLNPDGAKVFTRFNAQQIDLNRDALAVQSKEMQAFFKWVEEFKPHWAFNLHDQRNIFTCGNTRRPATISFLAPSANTERTETAAVVKSKQLISAIAKFLYDIPFIDIARFTDEYYPRAVGEFFQRNGVPCILIESGPAYHDPHRLIARKLNVLSLLQAFDEIANEQPNIDANTYEQLPINTQYGTDILLKNSIVKGAHGTYRADIALLAKENLSKNKHRLETCYTLLEVGDLSEKCGLQEYDSLEININMPLRLNEVVNFTAISSTQMLQFKNGFLM